MLEEEKNQVEQQRASLKKLLEAKAQALADVKTQSMRARAREKRHARYSASGANADGKAYAQPMAAGAMRRGAAQVDSDEWGGLDF